MAYQLTEINRRALNAPEDFVRECEARYEDQILHAANHIVENSKESRLVLLSGPSGSGKTTTSKKIEFEIRKRGIMTHAIGMDSYFKTIDPATAPRTPQGEIDFESPDCVDFALMKEQFDRFIKGNPVAVPRYNFAQQRRESMPAFVRRPTGNDIVIVEGIHALGDTAVRAFPDAYKVYISTSSDVMDKDKLLLYHSNMRMVRRIVRDNLFRGASPQHTLSMWENVRRGEILHIRPNKSRADLAFDSSFPYELCVMKSFFLELFKDSSPELRAMSEVQSVIDSLEHIQEIDSSLVPSESLLREFIGGGIYEY